MRTGKSGAEATALQTLPRSTHRLDWREAFGVRSLPRRFRMGKAGWKSRWSRGQPGPRASAPSGRHLCRNATARNPKLRRSGIRSQRGGAKDVWHKSRMGRAPSRRARRSVVCQPTRSRSSRGPARAERRTPPWPFGFVWSRTRCRSRCRPAGTGNGFGFGFYKENAPTELPTGPRAPGSKMGATRNQKPSQGWGTPV